MTNSLKYWEKRYKTGYNSGIGSYGELSIFKTDTVNNIIKENNIKSVVDFGFGDGNQIKNLLVDNYIGLDVSPTILKKCKKIFENDKSKTFHLYKGEILDKKYKRELGLSLDVLYHVTEEKLFKNYLENLFNLSEKIVIIYSMNHIEDNGYIIGRIFTKFVAKKYTEWKLVKKIPQKYPGDSSADFYIYQKICQLEDKNII